MGEIPINCHCHQIVKIFALLLDATGDGELNWEMMMRLEPNYVPSKEEKRN